MHLSSCLSCGLIPLWDAVGPRLTQRSADREAASKAAAERRTRELAEAGLRADNVERLVGRAAQNSWREPPPRPSTPQLPPALSRTAIRPLPRPSSPGPPSGPDGADTA